MFIKFESSESKMISRQVSFLIAVIEVSPIDTSTGVLVINNLTTATLKLLFEFLYERM